MKKFWSEIPVQIKVLVGVLIAIGAFMFKHHIVNPNNYSYGYWILHPDLQFFYKLELWGDFVVIRAFDLSLIFATVMISIHLYRVVFPGEDVSTHSNTEPNKENNKHT